MKYIVVYSTENSDLYYEEFDLLEEAQRFVQNSDDKAYILSGEVLENHT